ncbi:S9 family peptidase [Dokdonia donghaensis]|uniref:Proline-specific endopeptidase n=1 Tax=Dokdonia donghaensis DSW-1 TaxID=1300343 RepID=A0A0A2GX62_9FLAO|nr:oligopeptidase B [Dokdonia donghaensis]ANH60599.1 Protease 2 [Dokdonia donghaensis DSW-1]KGO07844.1 protease 2 [Dokdonia donghaensis DSW-1]
MIKNTIPPVAKKLPVQLEKHNDTRVDDYFWMNERDSPEVLSHLKEENRYYDEMTAHTKAFQAQLFKEMKGRIKEDDASVPYKHNGYWYYRRFETGKDYPLYCRKEGSLDAPEIIVFDNNEMADGHSYFSQASYSVSEDNTIAAYGIDTVSRRQYTIRFKNLVTEEILNTEIKNTTGGAVWANDNKTVYYSRKDEETLRSNQIFKHTLGTDPSEDVLVYQEDDETFYTYVFKSKSKKYILIGSDSTMTSEFRFASAARGTTDFKVFQERTRGLEYAVSHYDDAFYIQTNKDKATNFKVMRTPENQTAMQYWEDLIPHREDTLLEDVEIFKKYLVISERSNGLNKIRIKSWDDRVDYYLPFDNETYDAYPTTNIDFDTHILRYAYNALNTPASVIDFNMETQEKTILKEQEILGGNFSKDNYKMERSWAPAQDGAKIPISIVYHKDTVLDGNAPLLQYAYGSYGSTIDPSFSSIRLSLLDRGFIYAIAHIRGGEYLGRKWYEDGKLLKKKNTFTDFIDVSKFLIAQNYTSSKHLYAYGGSAGGLLIGAVINMAPELYNGVIAAVPFVDVVTTMLDDTIPLTTGEYDEWGNPNDKEYYDYMKSYSPYDNAFAKAYPNILVTTGYHDSQVQYWEPAKWVAKLRKNNTSNNQIIFQCNMDAGHGGASGRFEALKEVAQDYAFLLDLEGITK